MTPTGIIQREQSGRHVACLARKLPSASHDFEAATAPKEYDLMTGMAGCMCEADSGSVDSGGERRPFEDKVRTHTTETRHEVGLCARKKDPKPN